MTTFVALGHAMFGIVQFHALGDLHPLVSLLVSNTQLCERRAVSVRGAGA